MRFHSYWGSWQRQPPPSHRLRSLNMKPVTFFPGICDLVAVVKGIWRGHTLQSLISIHAEVDADHHEAYEQQDVAPEDECQLESWVIFGRLVVIFSLAAILRVLLYGFLGLQSWTLLLVNTIHNNIIKAIHSAPRPLNIWLTVASDNSSLFFRLLNSDYDCFSKYFELFVRIATSLLIAFSFFFSFCSLSFSMISEASKRWTDAFILI